MLPGMPKHLTKVTFKKLWGRNESCDEDPMFLQQHGAAYCFAGFISTPKPK
jgi:hypothetical protein